MDAAGTRFELRVGTLVSQATLGAFRLPLRRITVPRQTFYRLRISADHDVPTVLQQLTDRDVEVVEIRRCSAPPDREDGVVRNRREAARPEAADPPGSADGVVLPFRRRGPSSWDRPPSGLPTTS
jgi:hypothetical protein